MAKQTQKRVKVVSCEYHSDKNLVVWTVQPLDEDKPIKMAFKSTELGAAVGISGYIPPDAIEKFCKEITGKEINWVHEVTYENSPSLDDVSNEDLAEQVHELDSYPYEEIEDLE